MQRSDLSREIRWLLDEKYQGVFNAQAKKDIERLQAGEPVDYVIGFVRFLGCTIDLSKKPLIPRPETQEWTQKAIERIAAQGASKLFCLDIFAGSGCVGIALLAHIPYIEVHFAEKNPVFLEQIAINASRNHIKKERYRLLESDVFSNITQRYDYIFANPPYVAYEKREGVQESVKVWEPLEGVFAGHDGFLYLSPFIAHMREHLAPGGVVYIEFDDWQKPRVKKELRNNGYRRYTFCKDQFNRMRYVVVQA